VKPKSTNSKKSGELGDQLVPTAEAYGLTLRFEKTPEAIEAFKAGEAADDTLGIDDFATGVRRVVRFGAAKEAGLHKMEKLSWSDFVKKYYKEGPNTFVRMRDAAVVLKHLHAEQLPLIWRDAQSRALKPRLKESDFIVKYRQMVASNGGRVPEAAEIEKIFPKPAREKSNTYPNVVKLDDISSEELTTAIRVCCAMLLVEPEGKNRSPLSAALKRFRAVRAQKKKPHTKSDCEPAGTALQSMPLFEQAGVS
jgi:hypothetical protein